MLRAPSTNSVERFFQFSLLGLVTSGYLAVAGSGALDRSTMILAACALILRALVITGFVRMEIPDRLVNWVTILYIGFYFVDYFFISRDMLTGTVHLMFFLAIAKILTAKTNRDYLYTAAIAFVELLAAAILSSSLSFFAFLALYLLFAIAAFTSAEIRRSLQRSTRISRASRIRFSPRLATLSVSITAGILLLTAGLFFVLPRTANAALRHLVSSRYHLTGFSNEVLLGDIGDIQADSRAILHVKSYSREFPPNLKWRGAALTQFDGHKWSDASRQGETMAVEHGTIPLADEWQRRRIGRRVLYRVDMNTTDSDAVFIAGVPEFVNIGAGRLMRTSTGGYRLGYVPTESVRYEVSSFIGSPLTLDAPRHWEIHSSERARNLQLPAIDGRIPELARNVTRDELTDWQRAQSLQNYLRRSYAYSLELSSVSAPDPLADFLFSRRKGHCEYFASALAVMLRTLDIPARIVNGFQSGTFNPVSGQYVIRASDAHSWVEAFFPDRGWVGLDATPTASGAPKNLFSKIGLYLDAADTFWQEWVMSYDLGHQVTLAQRLEETTRRLHWELASPTVNWTSWAAAVTGWMKKYGGISTGSVLSAVILVAFRRRIYEWSRLRRIRSGGAVASDGTALYNRMLEIMRRRGFEKPGWFTPEEFVGTLPPSPVSALVAQFTETYEAVRFGRDARQAAQLGTLLNRIERAEN